MANSKLISMFAELQRQHDTAARDELETLRGEMRADLELALALVDDECNRLREEIALLREAVRRYTVERPVESVDERIEMMTARLTNLGAVVGALYEHLGLAGEAAGEPLTGEAHDEGTAEQTDQSVAQAADGTDQNEAGGAGEEPAEAAVPSGLP